MKIPYQILVFLLLVICSCSSNNSLLDSPSDSEDIIFESTTITETSKDIQHVIEALQNAQCELPCWRGIKLNEFTWDDLISYFQQQNEGFFSEDIEADRQNFSIPEQSQFFTSYDETYFFNEDGGLSRINIKILNPKKYLMQDILNHLGEPNEIYIQMASNITVKSQSLYKIILYYKEHGVFFETEYLISRKQANIYHEMSTHGILCFVESSTIGIEDWGVTESVISIRNYEDQDRKNYLEFKILNNEYESIFNINEFLGVTAELFYESFKNSGERFCLEMQGA